MKRRIVLLLLVAVFAAASPVNAGNMENTKFCEMIEQKLIIYNFSSSVSVGGVAIRIPKELRCGLAAGSQLLDEARGTFNFGKIAIGAEIPLALREWREKEESKRADGFRPRLSLELSRRGVFFGLRADW